jgi:hypothetical protein
MPALKDFISLSLAIARRIENPTLTTRNVRNVALVERSKFLMVILFRHPPFDSTEQSDANRGLGLSPY